MGVVLTQDPGIELDQLRCDHPEANPRESGQDLWIEGLLHRVGL